MPLKEVVVGDGGEYEEQAGEDHNHTEGFSMHFMAPKLTAEQEVVLVVHIQLDNEPLENLKVRYEIWNDLSEKHDWVDAVEIKAGEYTADYTFNEASTYHVQIHVQDENELHEHETFELIVK